MSPWVNDEHERSFFGLLALFLFPFSCIPLGFGVKDGLTITADR
jgi:hypothetical protein